MKYLQWAKSLYYLVALSYVVAILALEEIGNRLKLMHKRDT